MRWNSVALLGLALALVGTACAAPAGPGPGTPGDREAAASKKRMVAIMRGEPHTLSDTINSAGPGGVAGLSELSYLITSRLADTYQQSVVGLRLAEVAPTAENGLWRIFPDGRMETTWKLRRDARWHDGTPFTAEDMLFTTRLGQDREIGVLRHAAYNSVDSVEAPDAYTVTIQWRRPYIQADTWFGDVEPLPKHILETAFLEDKANFIQHPYFTSGQFVGTGPYKIREWALNSHLMLDAFDAFVLGRPKIDEIEVKFLLDPNVIIANMLAGAGDVTLGRGLSLEQGIEARGQWGDGRVEFSFGSWIALFPQFLNPSPAVIANLQFRRAMLHSLDRQQLADTILHGTVPVPHHYLSPSAPEYTETESAAVRYEYEPRRAAQMIEELGYSRRADGLYYDPAGQRLGIEIRTTAGDDLRDNLLFTSADQWKRFGIDTEPVVIPRQRAADREYRSERPGFELVRQPNDLAEGALRRFMSSEAALPGNQYRGQNRTRYSSPELDALIDGYLITIPRPERLDIGRQIVRHITENLPVMGVVYSSQAMFISNRMVNVDPTNDTRNGHLWDVRS